MNEPQYCGMEEIAQHLGVGAAKIRELVSLGMPCVRLGYRTLRFSKEACAAWVESYSPKID